MPDWLLLQQFWILTPTCSSTPSRATLDQVRAAWISISNHLLAILEPLGPEELDRPNAHRFPCDDTTVLGMVTFLTQHDSYQIGQVAFVRRQLGKPAMSYARGAKHNAPAGLKRVRVAEFQGTMGTDYQEGKLMRYVREDLLKVIVVCLGIAAPLACAGRAPTDPATTKPISRCQPEFVKDTTHYGLYITPPRSVPESWRHPDSYAPYGGAIASTLIPPVAVIRDWPVGPTDCAQDSHCGFNQLSEVQLSLKEGRVMNLDWYRRTDAVEIRRAVQAAVWKADSAGLFPKNVPTAGLPAGLVRLGLELSRIPPAIGFPVGVIPIWYIRVTTPIRAIFQPQPVYPDSAMQMRLSGSVTLEYAIRVDGTVPRSSIRVIEAQPQLFAQPAIESILASRFEPAKSGKCVIGTWVQQTLRFKVE